jgi:hypothetical protein
MKYRVKLLTQGAGLIEVIISEGDNISALEVELKKEFGTFVTISTTPIN